MLNTSYLAVFYNIKTLIFSLVASIEKSDTTIGSGTEPPKFDAFGRPRHAALIADDLSMVPKLSRCESFLLHL